MSMYVGQIVMINKIAGCAEYETAVIGNLPCVVKTARFKAKEHVMVFPVDTVVFVDENNVLLEDTAHNQVQEDTAGVRGVHVKPIMVQGQVSAGLVVKLLRFPKIHAKIQQLVNQEKNNNNNNNNNVAPKPPRSSQSRGFGLRRWRPTDPKTLLGERPAFVPTTVVPFADQAPEIFRDRANYPSIWQATPAMPNRLSMFIYVVQNNSVWARAIERRPAEGRGILPQARMGICGETRDYRDDGKSTIWESLSRTGVPAKLGQLADRNLAIEGVIWVTGAAMTPQGPRPHHQFKVFAVWDIDQQKRLSVQKTHEFADWLGLQMVPDLGRWGLTEIMLGEGMPAVQGVIYMSMDGQTVVGSRPTKDAVKLQRLNIESPW